MPIPLSPQFFSATFLYNISIMNLHSKMCGTRTEDATLNHFSFYKVLQMSVCIVRWVKYPCKLLQAEEANLGHDFKRSLGYPGLCAKEN